jgi:HTH-type transcriptional regulator, transcriptional repressor of NAD biosynthesis genes
MKIAILGAECTGKTQLAQVLVRQLQARYPRTTWVPEYLRTWCDTHGRTPRADEQRAIAQVQMDQVQMQATSDMVLCDTAPLMTAVYSDVIFGDTSLYEFALAQHGHFGLTLVTGLDLAWVRDGIQRDGEAVRARVDQRLREILAQYQIGFSAVYGTGEARAHSAMQAIDYALGTARPASQGSAWKWSCDTCSDADCEHRMFSALLGT